jgi:hypothetical protein
MAEPGIKKCVNENRTETSETRWLSEMVREISAFENIASVGDVHRSAIGARGKELS